MLHKATWSWWCLHGPIPHLIFCFDDKLNWRLYLISHSKNSRKSRLSCAEGTLLFRLSCECAFSGALLHGLGRRNLPSCLVCGSLESIPGICCWSAPSTIFLGGNFLLIWMTATSILMMRSSPFIHPERRRGGTPSAYFFQVRETTFA